MDRPRRPLHNPDDYIYTDDTTRGYWKLFGFTTGIFFVSLILTFGRGWGVKYLWQDFIAVLLITAAAQKIFHLEVFVRIYQSYDIIARRWPAWSYIYPFIEIALGADYLLSNGSVQLHVLTMLVMGIGTLSIIYPTKRKSHTQFASLDTIILLPLSTVTLITNIVVFLFALMMLLVY